MRLPVCGLPAPLSVNTIVPARSTPLGEPTLVNLTPTVQLAPGARVAPQQLSAPTTLLKKKVVRLPPETASEATVMLAPVVAGAVFVRVTAHVPVLTPAANVIVSGLGVIDTVARVATPVPVSVTGEPVTVAPV